jgi:aspartyl-tRNA(Asn)/glutamyl-tRNA(Gln) amidotransferase subunit A
MARSAADCARILDVIAGVDPNDPTSEPFPSAAYVDGLDRTMTGVRVGVVRSLWDGLSDVVAAPLHRATRALRHLGVELVDVEIGWWDQVVEAGEVLVECEAAAEYGDILEVSAAELLPEVKSRLRSGAATTARDYVRAGRIVTQFRHQYRRALRDVHLLVLPGHHRTAPRIDAHGRRLDASTSLRFTLPLNVIGAPALTMPAAFIDSLPISIQLAGLHGSESLLLAVAHAYQQVTSWHNQSPNPRNP